MLWISLIFYYRPQDYFRGDIKVENRTVSSIYGTYLGFVDFNGRRYWDAREQTIFKMKQSNIVLPSDASFRPDVQVMVTGNIDLAQTKKEELEQLQRHDARLRAATGKKH